MRTKLILTSAAALLLAACASKPEFPVEKTGLVEIHENSGATVEFVHITDPARVMRISRDGMEPTYAIVFQSVFGREIKANTVDLTIDGDSMVLTGSTTREAVEGYMDNALYRERAVFPVPVDLIQRLAGAETVNLRLRGEGGSTPLLRWDFEKLAAIAKFEDYFVDRGWDALDEEQRLAEVTPSEEDG